MRRSEGKKLLPPPSRFRIINVRLNLSLGHLVGFDSLERATIEIIWISSCKCSLGRMKMTVVSTIVDDYKQPRQPLGMIRRPTKVCWWKESSASAIRTQPPFQSSISFLLFFSHERKKSFDRVRQLESKVCTRVKISNLWFASTLQWNWSRVDPFQ